MERIRSAALVALLVLVAPSAGCKNTIEKALAKHGPAVRAMVAKAKALEPRVKAVRPITAAAVSPVKDLVVMRGGFGNAIVVHERDLRAPESFVYAPERPDIADELFHCADALTKKTDPADTYSSTVTMFEKGLQTCASTKYVLVMRTHKKRMAQIINGDHFMGGRVDGDIVAFTLAGHSLGGFPWHAESAERVQVTPGESQSSMQMTLDVHMREKVEAAIRQEITRNFGDKAW